MRQPIFSSSTGAGTAIIWRSIISTRPLPFPPDPAPALETSARLQHSSSRKDDPAMLIKYAAPLLLALLALLGVSAASAADSLILTGEVTYRERIALPPDARLRMTLVRLPGETVVV